METIQMENETIDDSLKEEFDGEITIPHHQEHVLDENMTENQSDLEPSKKMDDILRFRDHLLAREILSCGINISDKILHFGAGYNNSLVWDYLSEIKKENLVQDLHISYTAVDVNPEVINDISKKNLDYQLGIDLRLINNTMQSFVDSNTDEFDWSIITGIFDKNLYGETQFEFLDKIMSSLLNSSREGLIFSFDTSKEKDEEYNIESIISYISSLYSRFRINRINEQNYIICIYKYYHSIIPQ